ncbi:MAG: efflux RND transporter periplasmic adaptor subunit [Phycisphaerales bacterium]|nr:efflux RND transporter periplasmic adaptor subunit [Phycisphaerales bacterium]
MKLNSGDPSALPKRGLAPLLIPALVVVCTLGTIFYSILPVLRSSRTIQIVQAIHVRNTNMNLDLAATKDDETLLKKTRTVQAAGWLEAEPFYVAATALTDGVVDEMLVIEGDYVEKGQVLARMVDDDAKLRLARAEAELLKAKASRSKAQVALNAANENWASPFELERDVASSRASLTALQAELDQLSSLIRIEESLVVKTQEELKSMQIAYERNAASTIEFVSAREIANAQSARLESLKAKGPILNASVDRMNSDLFAAEKALQLRIDDRARVDSNQALLDEAHALVILSEVQRDESQLELDRMKIKAPITGFVQRRLKIPGDKVVRMMDSPHSAHIAHLYDPSKLQVRVDVPLADASEVFVGQKCEVVVEVFADRIFQGEVLRVTNEADLQKNTLQVKVRVVDPDPLLRPEMLTRVKFLPNSKSGGSVLNDKNVNGEMVRVPQSSIQNLSDGPQVWVVADRANGKGVLVPVRVSPIETVDNWVTVQGLLQPGALIAVDPEGCVLGERIRFNFTQGGV